jgi:hypothetical protein
MINLIFYVRYPPSGVKVTPYHIRKQRLYEKG